MATEDQGILYLDIETVPGRNLQDKSDKELYHLWYEKYCKQHNEEQVHMAHTASEDEELPDVDTHDGGLYAEFGQIACISFGRYYPLKDGGLGFLTSSFYGTDEKRLLQSFADLIEKKCGSITKLCGHNAKDFDIPFIIRRMLINNVRLPQMLQLHTAKPWETPVIDTMELWKFGATKYPVQLKVLCAVLGITTPKDDIDGSEVAGVFYNEEDYDRIATYCEKDVVATMQIYRRMYGLKAFADGRIQRIESKPFLLESD